MNDVMTADRIARSLPLDVLKQKIFKCKVIFLDVDKRDGSYSKVKRFSANCHEYSVVDGEISYLPEEAYSALQNAVSYINRPATKAQEKDGINHESPADRYEKIEIKRFDLTVLDVMVLVIGEDGKRYFKSVSEKLTELEIDETQKAIIESEKDKIREEEREKYEEKLAAEIAKLKAELPQTASDEEIDRLLGDE